jgi:hypothetical protein
VFIATPQSKVAFILPNKISYVCALVELGESKNTRVVSPNQSDPALLKLAPTRLTPSVVAEVLFLIPYMPILFALVPVPFAAHEIEAKTKILEDADEGVIAWVIAEF